MSNSDAAGFRTEANAAYRITSAARDKPSASIRVICTSWSGSMPSSMNFCANAAASASARRWTAASGSSTRRQPHGPLNALKQIEVDTRLLAGLARRDVGAVVAEYLPCGQQRGREGAPDLVDGDAPLEQPRDQFGAFGTGFALEAVE